MKVEITPNEVLIRYDKDGIVQGMHYVKTVKVIDEKGNIFSQSQGNPEAVTLGIEEGLDLEAVLGDINTANIKSIELLNSEKKTLETELKSSKEKLSETSNLLTEANTQIEQLKAELEKSNQQLVEVNKANEELIKNISDASQTPLKDEDIR